MKTPLRLLMASAWVAAALVQAQSALAVALEADQKALVGLWGQVRVFPPAGRLVVHLHKEPGGYVARADDEVVRIPEPADRTLNIRFPLGAGSFRGTIKRGSRNIHGHWVSEPSTFMYSHFAAPLTLKSNGRGRWTGEVERFDQRFSIYVKISPTNDGKTNSGLRAFLRNPERNQGVNTRLHHVTQNGSQVSFSNASGDAVLSGQLSLDAQTLSVSLPGRGGTYDLQRLDRKAASGFYPRRDTSPYRYQAPPKFDDGWQVAHAETVDIEHTGIEALVQSILSEEASSIRSPYIHSMLIARRGKLISEEYFHGYHADRLHDLRSATKSVTGLMTGIALAGQQQLSVDSAVYPLFGSELLAPGLLKDPRRSALTLRHLLTMSGGFDCDDNDYQTPGNEDRMQEQVAEPDWWRYTLNLPLVSEPGTKAVYCSAGVNLLGGAISKISGRTLPEFFDTRLARPLDITHYQMNLDPLQRGYSGGGIRMRPRDFLKIGQLMLDNGKWRGQQIVPREWVLQSMRGQTSIHESGDYGFTWWVGTLKFAGEQVDVISATGNGGQMLVIVPQLEMVVGFTGGNYGDFRTWISWREQLLPDKLFPAISNP